MRYSKNALPGLLAALFFLFSQAGFCSKTDIRAVKDFRGTHVTLPQEINRVVTISDGMIAGVMTALGVEKKIVAIGSGCIPKVWDYAYPGPDNETSEYHGGMSTVTCLNPWLTDLPLVARFETGINYELIAGVTPDLVILRTGSCSLSCDRKETEKSIRIIQSLGIPVVVLYGPNTCETPNIRSIRKEIEILGRVFQKEPEADRLCDFLENTVALVRTRTESIPENEKKRLLLLGLSSTARSKGGAAHVKGSDTIQTHFIDSIVHARNALNASGAWNILNTEQILALDPDAILLVTAWGYHPPEELYHTPAHQGLRNMRAVKNRSVAALPWTPCNCEKRLEYPIDIMVMAKTAYPERFRDIDLSTWLLNFYRNLYHVDVDTARKLRSCQWMNWTIKE